MAPSVRLRLDDPDGAAALAAEIRALAPEAADVSEQVVTRDVLRQELKALLEDLHARDAAVSPAPSGPAASV